MTTNWANLAKPLTSVVTLVETLADFEPLKLLVANLDGAGIVPKPIGAQDMFKSTTFFLPALHCKQQLATTTFMDPPSRHAQVRFSYSIDDVKVRPDFFRINVAGGWKSLTIIPIAI